MLGLGINLWRAALSGGAAPFDPASLSPYSWFDPSDLSTLWQDTAGTSPVTADGQSVARIDDKSGNGRHMIQGTAANRPLYKTDGTLHWLLFDGVNDRLRFPNLSTLYNYVLPNTHEVVAAASHLSLSAGFTGSLWQYVRNNGTEFSCELGIYNASGNYRIRSQYPSIDTFSTGPILTSPTTTAHVVGSERRSGTDLRLYVDGTQQMQVTTSSAAIASSEHGNGVGEHRYAAQFIGMRWYGCVITDPLTTDERAALTTYLGAKAGLML